MYIYILYIQMIIYYFVHIFVDWCFLRFKYSTFSSWVAFSTHPRDMVRSGDPTSQLKGENSCIQYLYHFLDQGIIPPRGNGFLRPLTSFKQKPSPTNSIKSKHISNFEARNEKKSNNLPTHNPSTVSPSNEKKNDPTVHDPSRSLRQRRGSGSHPYQIDSSKSRCWPTNSAAPHPAAVLKSGDTFLDESFLIGGFNPFEKY